MITAIPYSPVYKQTIEDKLKQTPADQYWDVLVQCCYEWFEALENCWVFIPELKAFYQYEEGYYQKRVDEELYSVFQKFFEFYGDMDASKITNDQIKEIVHWVQRAHFVKLQDFDAQPNEINCVNGWVVFNSELCFQQLLPHSSDHYSLWQWSVQFTIDPADTAGIDRIRATYPAEFFRLERFVQMMIRKDMRNELMLFGYGPTGSGKSTIASLIDAILKGALAHKSMEQFDNEFGMSGCEGKYGNLEKDATIGYIGRRTLAIWKKIVGNDGDQEINIKHVRQFDYQFRYFFILMFSNQLPKLPPTDLKAWFRRVWLISFGQTQKSDAALKTQILNEVNDWFSELVLMPYTMLKPDGTNVDKFWLENKKEWDASADPIAVILKNALRRGTGMDAIAQEDLVSYCESKLSEIGAGIPRDLKSLVTQVLKTMNIHRVRRKINVYMPVELIDKDLLAQQQLQNDVDGVVAEEKRGHDDTIPGTLFFKSQ